MSGVLDRIEHTALGPATTWDDVSDVLDAALRYGLRACIPPCYLDAATAYAPNVDVSTVVGFPHGQHATEIKCEEARRAWRHGAAEVDVVSNRGFLAGDEHDRYRADLAEVVAAVPIPVKAIVEAPALTTPELEAACELATAADVAFLKTATGFGAGGATVEDVSRMARYRPVKASGGIGSWDAAERMLDAGADRIGASSGSVIATEYLAADGDEPAADRSGTDHEGDEPRDPFGRGGSADGPHS